MHSRIYALKRVSETDYKKKNEDDLFEYLTNEGTGIDYVDEMDKLTFDREVKDFKIYFLDTITKGTEIKEKDGKYYLKIPTKVLSTYVKDCIEDCKSKVNQLDYDKEVDLGQYGTWRATYYLGDWYENLCIDKFGNPTTFYSWATGELYDHKDEKFLEYEVMQVFDFHY